jgi:thiol:disulfide interchange protein DsbD
VLALVWGVLLLVGAASGAVDPLRPLAPLTAGAGSGVGETAVDQVQVWHPVDTLADLDREISGAGGRMVILDLYADWCISCKVMERRVFPHPEVAPLLARFHLARADITADLPEHRALLERYGLFGPPSLVFFSPQGEELQALRIQGEIDAAALKAHLERVLASGRG